MASTVRGWNEIVEFFRTSGDAALGAGWNLVASHASQGVQTEKETPRDPLEAPGVRLACETRRCWSLPLVLLLAVILGSCVKVLTHDEHRAGAIATEFAEHACIRGDYVAAYTLMSEEARKGTSVDALKAIITRMHPSARPTRIAATEFEPMPGQAAMQIYLSGTGEGEDFRYRTVMQGTVQAGYKVAGFYRLSGSEPVSPLRKPLESQHRSSFSWKEERTMDSRTAQPDNPPSAQRRQRALGAL